MSIFGLTMFFGLDSVWLNPLNYPYDKIMANLPVNQWLYKYKNKK